MRGRENGLEENGRRILRGDRDKDEKVKIKKRKEGRKMLWLIKRQENEIKRKRNKDRKREIIKREKRERGNDVMRYITGMGKCNKESK